jgi:hypothetical protein
LQSISRSVLIAEHDPEISGPEVKVQITGLTPQAAAVSRPHKQASGDERIGSWMDEFFGDILHGKRPKMAGASRR